MKRIAYTIAFIILIVLGIQATYSQEKSDVKASDVIDKINEFFKENTSLKGDFDLIVNGRVSKGYFLFKHPHFFKMVFGSKKGSEANKKRIISNGKILWIYLPGSRLVVEQDLKRTLDSIEVPSNLLGIRRLIRHYTYKFENNNPALRQIDGLSEKTYVLQLAGKNEDYGFEKLLFYVRADGFIVKSVAVRNKKKFVLIRRNVKLKPNIDDREFLRKVPRNARIIKNPFVSGRGY